MTLSRALSFIYNIEVTCQCTKLPQLIQASEDVSWCLDAYVRRDARDNVDKVSASWVQMPDDEICSTVDLESRDPQARRAA